MKKIMLFLALFMVIATILVAQPKPKPNLYLNGFILSDKTTNLGYSGIGINAGVSLFVSYRRIGAEIIYHRSTLKKENADTGFNQNASANLLFRVWKKFFLSAGVRHDYYIYRFPSGGVWEKEAYSKVIGIRYGLPYESHLQLEYAPKENYTQNKRTSFSAELMYPLFKGNPRILLTNRFTLVRFSQLYQGETLRLTGFGNNFGISISWQVL